MNDIFTIYATGVILTAIYAATMDDRVDRDHNWFDWILLVVLSGFIWPLIVLLLIAMKLF